MNDIAHIIQLSVAPVFLLTGIAGLLGVMSTRLGRITDRARVIERRLQAPLEQLSAAEQLRAELRVLWRRGGLVNLAISLCTAAALLVCLLIVGLFLGGFSALDLSVYIAASFVLSMLLLVLALLLFLREIAMATRTLRQSMVAVDESGAD